MPARGADCNSNGVNDAMDISGGTSRDCNANGVPDECDIAGATSQDANGDTVPDEPPCTYVYDICAADLDLRDSYTSWQDYDTGSGAEDYVYLMPGNRLLILLFRECGGGAYLPPQWLCFKLLDDQARQETANAIGFTGNLNFQPILLAGRVVVDYPNVGNIQVSVTVGHDQYAYAVEVPASGICSDPLAFDLGFAAQTENTFYYVPITTNGNVISELEDMYFLICSNGDCCTNGCDEEPPPDGEPDPDDAGSGLYICTEHEGFTTPIEGCIDSSDLEWTPGDCCVTPDSSGPVLVHPEPDGDPDYPLYPGECGFCDGFVVSPTEWYKVWGVCTGWAFVFPDGSVAMMCTGAPWCPFLCGLTTQPY